MRPLRWLCLLAGIAIAIWLWTSDGAEVAPATDSGPSREVAAEVPARPAAATEAQGEGNAQRIAVTPAFDGPTAVVQVVEFGSGAPVAGATVWFQPPGFDLAKLPEAERERLQPVLELRDTEARLEAIGSSTVSDADGRCQVPLGEHGTEVVARHGTRFGQRWVRASEGDEPHTVTLREDRTLRVRVIDHGGAPAAGVAVHAEPVGVAAERAMRWSVGETGANGVVESRHSQRKAGETASALIEVRVVVPGAASDPVQVDVVSPPPEVVLRLPPCGSVSVRFVEADGRPVEARYLDQPKVQLRAFEPGTGSHQSAHYPGDSQHFEAWLDEESVAHFRHVGLRRTLEASHSFGAGVAFEGPRLPGQHVETELRWPEGGVVVIGRAVDTDGKAIVATQLICECLTRTGMRGALGRSDESGRFRFQFGAEQTATDAIVRLRTHEIPGTSANSAELEPRALVKGENDLGEVVLLKPRAIVSGKLIVDGEQDPRTIRMQVDRQQESRWSQEYNLHPQIAADGSFRIVGSSPEGTPLRLTVQCDRFLPVEPIETTAGTTGLEIRLRTGGQVEATFLVDADTPLRNLIWRLRPASEERPDFNARVMEMRVGHMIRADDDGVARHTWGGLQPGTYRLSVLCPGFAEPIVSIEDLLVAEGSCLDQRLRAIDLRGRLRAIEIAATGADGQRIADPNAFVLVGTGGGDRSGYGLRTGAASVLTVGPAELTLLAPGHRAAVITGVTEDRTVQLDSAPEVVLRVDPGMQLPDDVRLALELEPLWVERGTRVTLDNGGSMGLGSFLSCKSALDRDGTARILLQHGGRYRVQALIVRRGLRRYLRAVEPKELELDPAAPPGELTVRIDPDALRRAIAELR